MRGSRLLKWLDRYLGVPMVLTIGLLVRMARRPPLFPSITARRIGVLKENAIGDTVVLAAALADLRRTYPQSDVILFVGQSNLAFAKLLDVPNHIEFLPLNRPLRCIAILRAQHLDLLFDAGQWPRINALLAAFSGAKGIVGFKTRGQHRHFAYDIAVEHRADLHEVDNFRRLVSFGRAPSDAPQFGFRYDECPRVVDEPYAVLHQWAGGERSELKEWQQHKWAAVIEYLLSRGNAVVLTGGPEDRPRNEALMQQFHGKAVLNAAGRPLAQLPDLLVKARIVISVNTGLMHLAATLGVPVIGLHGPTSIARWGPQGSRAVAVASRSPRSQYLNLGFEYPKHCEAMQKLEVDDVILAISQLDKTAH